MGDRRECKLSAVFVFKTIKINRTNIRFQLNKYGIYGILNIHGNMYWSTHDRAHDVRGTSVLRRP